MGYMVLKAIDNISSWEGVVSRWANG